MPTIHFDKPRCQRRRHLLLAGLTVLVLGAVLCIAWGRTWLSAYASLYGEWPVVILPH